MHLKKQVILAPHTYFKLGGPADYFVEVKTRQELIDAVLYAQNHSLPYFVLGGGSNILVTDKGYRGLVIKNQTQSLSLSQTGATAASGVPINRLITYTINHSLAGLEDFLGLPGTVGGAIYNNSHHLGDLIGNHVSEVELLTQSGEVKIVPAQDLNFLYDYSRLHVSKEVLLSATFKLVKGNKEELMIKSQQAVQRRAKTQPLGNPSSGCIFKNITLSQAKQINTPNHTLSAGYLIDSSGLKGTRVGGAVVSTIHANFIINDGTAKSQDVLDLIEIIKVKIKKTYGVDLIEEVFLIGEK